MFPKDAVYRTCRISGEFRIDLGRGCSDFPGATVAHCQQQTTTSGFNLSRKVVAISYTVLNGQDFLCSAHTVYLLYVLCVDLRRPPLWSSGQSFWLQIQRSRVRFPALPDFLSSSGSGTGSTQPREVN